MSLLGNILWIIFGGGGIAALLYALFGVLLCLTIVGIPFGLQCFRQAGAVLAPFGKEVRNVPGEEGCLPMAFNLIWLLVAGWGIALAHVSAAIACGITIIGIPFAIQHFKLIIVALFPFGHRLEPKE